jgi:hypothetical protein
MTQHANELAAAIHSGDAVRLSDYFANGGVLGMSPEGFAIAPPKLRYVALAGAALPLVHGRDLERGLPLAEALLIIAEREFKDDPQDPVLAEIYGQAADLTAIAYGLEGRFEKVVRLARDVPPRIIARTNGYQAVSLCSRGVDALMELGRTDEARSLLAQAGQYDDWYLAQSGQRDPNLPFVRDRLENAIAPVTQLAVAQESDKQAASSFVREAYKKLGRIMGREDELMRTNIVVQESSAILLDPEGGWEPGRLEDARIAILAALDWYDVHEHKLEALDALWPVAVMSRRLGDHEEALAAMARMRQMIETRRLGISNPLEAGALFSRFPYLYENIVLSSLEIGRIGDALSAIEASKGRAIAELRAARRQDAEDECLSRETLAAARAAEEIDALTANLDIDYLSLFVGTDETIGILVTRSGERRFQRSAIPKEQLKKLARLVDPLLWRAYGAKRVDQELHAIIDWTLQHLTADTLIISPDDPLHNLPFHYLQADGGRMVDRVSIAKVHGADDLRAIAAKDAERPQAATFVFLPASDEGGEPEGRRKAFDRLCRQVPIHVDEVEGTAFDATTARRLSIRGRLLHLAAHGHASSSDPYHRSGILLASEGRLPSRGALDESKLLSPSMIMESGELEIEGAIVAMQACVSGLSEEGRAGDPLGLEWALVARGASTVVASHWNIKFSVAVAFFERFYAFWLGEGLSRAVANRRAMLAVRDDPALPNCELDWAAFTLIGDWR